MHRIKSYLILLAAVLLAGCNGIDRPFTGTFDQVLIYYGMGYNNLSGNLRTNLDQLRTDVLPGLSYDKAIVVFCHNTVVSGNYKTYNEPVLMRFYRGSDGKPVTDTLKVYDNMDVSASKESMRQVLEDVKERFPARRYGLLVSSHGTGWLPPGYNYNSEAPRQTRRKALAQPAQPWPETKAIGNQYLGSSANTTWVQLEDFAEAIPMHLDYLILDNCLSGAVELAYELKDVCDRFVVSPAEILTAGMVYSTLSWDMFAGGNPDLRTYCREYFQYYDAQSGNHRAGTVTLVESAGLDALAGAFGAIVDAHRAALADPAQQAAAGKYRPHLHHPGIQRLLLAPLLLRPPRPLRAAGRLGRRARAPRRGARRRRPVPRRDPHVLRPSARALLRPVGLHPRVRPPRSQRLLPLARMEPGGPAGRIDLVVRHFLHIFVTISRSWIGPDMQDRSTGSWIGARLSGGAESRHGSDSSPALRVRSAGEWKKYPARD